MQIIREIYSLPISEDAGAPADCDRVEPQPFSWRGQWRGWINPSRGSRCWAGWCAVEGQIGKGVEGSLEFDSWLTGHLALDDRCAFPITQQRDARILVISGRRRRCRGLIVEVGTSPARRDRWWL
jgi:hypothetical protein